MSQKAHLKMLRIPKTSFLLGITHSSCNFAPLKANPEVMPGTDRDIKTSEVGAFPEPILKETQVHWTHTARTLGTDPRPGQTLKYVRLNQRTFKL